MTWTNPRTWVAGEIVTAAQLNAHLRDQLKALGDTWTPYTPTMGGFTLGNGSLAAAYRLVGQTLDFRIRFTFGSSSASSAGMILSIPTPLTLATGLATGLRWHARDVSLSAVYFGDCDVVGGSTGFNLRNTAPFTWAAGDFLGVAGTVEVV